MARKNEMTTEVRLLPSLPSFLTLLLVALKVLEVGNVATWSWWWVLSPLWIALGLSILLMLRREDHV